MEKLKKRFWTVVIIIIIIIIGIIVLNNNAKIINTISICDISENLWHTIIIHGGYIFIITISNLIPSFVIAIFSALLIVALIDKPLKKKQKKLSNRIHKKKEEIKKKKEEIEDLKRERNDNLKGTGTITSSGKIELSSTETDNNETGSKSQPNIFATIRDQSQIEIEIKTGNEAINNKIKKAKKRLTKLNKAKLRYKKKYKSNQREISEIYNKRHSNKNNFINLNHLAIFFFTGMGVFLSIYIITKSFTPPPINFQFFVFGFLIAGLIAIELYIGYILHSPKVTNWTQNNKIKPFYWLSALLGMHTFILFSYGWRNLILVRFGIPSIVNLISLLCFIWLFHSISKIVSICK